MSKHSNRDQEACIRSPTAVIPHSDFRIHTSNMSTFRSNIGNERYVEVTEWKGERRVDLREWQYNKPSKKGISVTLMRWKNWVDGIEYLDQALANKQAYSSHLGGNVYCTVEEGSGCVNIRQYWKPEEKLVPTKKGLCLRPLEYQRLKELVPEIGQTLPELNSVVPCFLQSDHMNQLGALQCPECNPNDCTTANQSQTVTKYRGPIRECY